MVFGIYATSMLNIQFMPTFEPDVLSVQIHWPGASSKELYETVIKPIQNEIKHIPNLITIEGRANTGYASISAEFKSGVNLDDKMDDLKTHIESLSLPKDIEEIKYIKPILKEDIMGLILHGPALLDQIRYYALATEESLLNRQIDDIRMHGLSDQTLNINISLDHLTAMRMSVGDIANLIHQQSNDQTIGELLTNRINIYLKSSGEITQPSDLNDITIKPKYQDSVIRLRQFATTSLDNDPESPMLYYNGKPAVTLHVNRFNKNGGHLLNQITEVKEWLKTKATIFPKIIQIKTYSEQWKMIYDRISILIKNGLAGFICILILLNIFFFRRLAIWVAFGIPISISTALFILYLSGGSINFLSTFALIMCLGIIVDDTIVISEQAFSNLQNKMAPFSAVHQAVTFMLKPIFASSLTTICAFIPLLVIDGLFGQILFSIPFVVICVILGSIIECFVILPHHLYHSFLKQGNTPITQKRRRIDQFIHLIQFQYLKSFLNQLLDHKIFSLISVSAIIIVPFFALSQGLPRFEFFPSPPPNILLIKTLFYPGISSELSKHYLFDVDSKIMALNSQLGYPIKDTIIGVSSKDPYARGNKGAYDPRSSYILLDTVDIDKRKISNEAIYDAIRAIIPTSDIVESQQITAIGTGPPNSDLQILLQGQDPTHLKLAANALKTQLKNYSGVDNIMDNFPYGMEEYVINIKPEAQFFGFTNEDISTQLKYMVRGKKIQDYASMRKNVDVDVRLDKKEISYIEQIEQLPIITPQGQIVSLGTVADIQVEQSFNNYNSYNGALSVLVSAQVNREVNNSSMLIQALKKDVFPNIANQYGIQFNLDEQSKYGKEALEEIKFGVVIGLFLIYAILAWSSNSFVWPFIMMLVIPFGLAGAIIGHILLGYDMTLMSIFGMFGLTGIVINNAIILQHRFQQIVKEHPNRPRKEQVIEATCQRFRSIILTTLTTIVGLVPLILETSLSARFLIPMAISISFGLLVANILLILVLPILMNVRIYKNKTQKIDYS